ncbi:acyclic terpene utilization AtuA family protein [Nocardia sp. NPDC058518]|uniref:acyclic terpene utilization AtuA family protein n=1 Tax=Nocardia sp. NPDC058518 TaxID=3346534 RepID=UPI0036670688
MKTVTIGGAAGMWGDSYLATPQLLADGRCEYLIYESLAEITMAVLSKARMKDPGQGYARDVIRIIGENIAAFVDGGIKVITNAGGINPHAAAEVLRTAAAVAGRTVSIATVTGDDVLPLLDSLRDSGLRETTRGTPVPQRPISMNAYLGARPIAAALAAGADIVVTGRCADSALVLGPLMHEFGWAVDDFDQLSQGSLAGHLLECGPQSTGGLLTDWQSTGSWARSGYPIAEVRADGSFVVTIASGTDGLVDRRTVGEQLVYEIGDPAAYLLPDVVCDWTQVRLAEIGPNRVAVSGARGIAPTPTLKACAQVPDGARAQIMFFLGGHDAVAKGRRVAADMVARFGTLLTYKGFPELQEVQVDVLGAEDTYGPHARRAVVREVWLRIALRHDDPAALSAVIREFPSMGLSGPPGIGGGGALPTPSPVLRLDSFLVPRELLPARVEVDGRAVEFSDVPPELCETVDGPRGVDPVADSAPGRDTVEVPLRAIAYGRSGDKGADVNVGVIARRPEFEPILHAQVTAKAVGKYLAHLGSTSVQRYGLPGLHAVNFLLHDGLGAGGTASLRVDPQGKAVAQQLLDMPVEIPAALRSLISDEEF